MIWCTGENTSIIRYLKVMVPHITINRFDLDLADTDYKDLENKVPKGSHFVLCAGVLYAHNILDQSPDERSRSINVNMLNTVALIEAILRKNEKAKIIVMGSASGVKGSYDTVYAMAKAGLHQYIRNKELLPDQQLVAIAPSIIGDSGMTLSRLDTERLKLRAEINPKKRFISAAEIARLIYFLLYIDHGFITNTVINMTGGEVRW